MRNERCSYLRRAVRTRASSNVEPAVNSDGLATMVKPATQPADELPYVRASVVGGFSRGLLNHRRWPFLSVIARSTEISTPQCNPGCNLSRNRGIQLL